MKTTSDLAKRIQKKHQERAEEIEIINKAHEYNIRFNMNNMDFWEYLDSDEFFNLANEVEDYEISIRQAEELGIDWDYSEYDPKGLEQEIQRERSIQEETPRQMTACEEHRINEIRILASSSR